MDELLDGDATAIARAVSSGEVSATELVEACLRRLDERNGALNAVVAGADDAALEEAAASPRRAAASSD